MSPAEKLIREEVNKEFSNLSEQQKDAIVKSRLMIQDPNKPELIKVDLKDESELNKLRRHINKLNKVIVAAQSLAIRCNGISVYGRNPEAYSGADEELQEKILLMYDRQCSFEDELAKLNEQD